MRFLILQHIACEHPGVFAEVMRERGIHTRSVELDQGERIPDPADFDALLVFGGPMSVYDEDRYPWLTSELAAIRRAVERDAPFLGVCLGAQLLARALGAKVTRNAVPEVGLLEIELTPEGLRDPLFAGLLPKARVFQWHGDTFEVPARSVWLARSELCAHQAFRHGRRAYGLQYHVEVTPRMVAEWGAVEAYCGALREATGSTDVSPLVKEAEAHGGELRRHARRLFENFLRLL